MATNPAAGAAVSAAEVSIHIPAVCESASAKREKRLNRFVRFVAFWEWAGNAFGALAFLWATVVLLGGFCSDLKPADFWFATIMIFIEAFRIFSRSYGLDHQSLFGTTRALRWIRSSFARMLKRPRDGNEMVLIMGLWIHILGDFPSQLLPYPSSKELIMSILKVALLILLSRRPRQPGRCQMWAVVIVGLLSAAYYFSSPFILWELSRNVLMLWWLDGALPRLIEFVAVLLLILRPRRLAYVTSTPGGRKLIYLGKGISVVWLASCLVYQIIPSSLLLLPDVPTQIYYSFSISFTAVILSLGSLQNPADSLLGRCIDVTVHILFLWSVVWTSSLLSYLFVYFSSWPLPSQPVDAGLSFTILLVLLLIGNLQIPAAVVQIMLSSLRLVRLLADLNDDSGPDMDYDDSGENMVLAIAAFYLLAACQGALYVMASVLGLLSSLPRRSLIRRSKLSGELGVKAIDLYYQRAYATRMEIGVFAEGSTISFANFAIESLSSTSRELQVAGVCVLDSILQRGDRSNKDLVLRATSSTIAVSTLIGMLAWTEVENSYLIRQFAASVTIELADRLRIDSIPGMVKLVFSLLGSSPRTLCLINSQGIKNPQHKQLLLMEGMQQVSHLLQSSSQLMEVMEGALGYAGLGSR